MLRGDFKPESEVTGKVLPQWAVYRLLLNKERIISWFKIIPVGIFTPTSVGL